MGKTISVPKGTKSDLMIIKIPVEDFKSYKQLMSVSISLSDSQKRKLLDAKAVTIMSDEVE